MSRTPNHYETLDVSPNASQAEIKRAYRDLVKRFHPDRNPGNRSHDRMASINVAYEVLSDPFQRRTYDHQIKTGWRDRYASRQERNAQAEEAYHQQRQRGQTEDEQLKRWIRQIYQPINRLLTQILNPLQEQIDELAADPFDDELMENFQAYLEDCRLDLEKAHQLFQSAPNPSAVAGVAAHLYYCLNQIGDGLDELERFTMSYSEHYLHTGQELFRIAWGLRREAQAAMQQCQFVT